MPVVAQRIQQRLDILQRNIGIDIDAQHQSVCWRTKTGDQVLQARLTKQYGAPGEDSIVRLGRDIYAADTRLAGKVDHGHDVAVRDAAVGQQ